MIRYNKCVIGINEVLREKTGCRHFVHLFRKSALSFIDLFYSLFISISFISSLIFVIFFLLLILGLGYSSSSSLRCKVRLFI